MDDSTPDPQAAGRPYDPRADFPVFAVPASAFERFQAVVLDPDTAHVVGDERPPRPTVYRPDRLLIPGVPGDPDDDPTQDFDRENPRTALQELRRIGEEMDFTVDVLNRDVGDLARTLGYSERLRRSGRIAVRLVPTPERLGKPRLGEARQDQPLRFRPGSPGVRQVQSFPHAERPRHPLEQREPVVEPGGAQGPGEIRPHRTPPGHHQHRQPEPLGQVGHVHHGKAGDRDAAEDHALERGPGAKPADPPGEIPGHVFAVHRKLAHRHGLDPVRALHDHADDRDRPALSLVEGRVVYPDEVRSGRRPTAPSDTSAWRWLTRPAR